MLSLSFEPIAGTSLFNISGVLLAGAILTGAASAPEAATLDPAAMGNAIQYLGVLRDKAISAEDEAWLTQQWQDDAALSPQTIAAEVDHLALQFERHQKTPDPLALANNRTDLLKNVYCTARQSGDPTIHRLSDILAPDEVVLAADCILGLVITRFDIDGAAASHALVAAVTGRSHDAEGDKAELVNIVEGGFAAATPQEKAQVARAEFRHAILARFWSRIEGTTEQRAVIDEISAAAAADLRGPARALEDLAASKLGDVDYLAKVGDAKLTAGMIGIQNEWLEYIAGYSFSSRDRAWMLDAIIDEFRANPGETLDQIATLKTLNTNYRASSDVDEKTAMVAAWGASLYCFSRASNDPDDIYLAEVLFRHDPVTDADCDAGRVSRSSDKVLAEAGGQRLTDRDLTTAKRFASVMLGRSLLPEEEAIIRDDSIQSFKKDLSAWNENDAFYQAFLGKIDKRQGNSVFLAMDERKKLFDPVYCSLRASDEPFAQDYVQMFQRGDAILFEDCDEQLVTTEDEVEALAGTLNFLALINDMPPLHDADVKESLKASSSENINRAESMQLALNEWWSLLTLDEKAAEADKMRRMGIKPGVDGETLRNFMNTVELTVVAMNARLQSCKMLAITIQGMTAIYGASIGPGAVTGSNPSGIPGEQLGGLVSATNAAREICRDVMGG